MFEVIPREKFLLKDGPHRPRLKMRGNRLVTTAGNIPIITGYKEDEPVYVISEESLMKLVVQAYEGLVIKSMVGIG